MAPSSTTPEPLTILSERIGKVERDAYFLKGMAGIIIAMLLGTLAIQWQILMKMGEIEARLAGLEVRVELAIDRRLEPSP